MHLLGTGLRIAAGTRVTATRATNQPNTHQWFIRPVGGIWDGIGETADPNDSILIAEEEIPEDLGFYQPGTESRIPRLVPRVEPDEADIVDWTEALFDQDLGMHPDDSAEEIVDRDGKTVFTPTEAVEMDLILDYLHAVKCLNTGTSAIEVYTDTAIRFIRAAYLANSPDSLEAQSEELRKMLRTSPDGPIWVNTGITPGWYWMWSGITHEEPAPVQVIMDPRSDSLMVSHVAHLSVYRKALSKLVGSGFMFYPINGWPALTEKPSNIKCKVLRTWDISFTHIPMSDRELTEVKHPSLVINEMNGGRTVRFPVYADKSSREENYAGLLAVGFSPYLIDILKIALEHQFDYIEFDVDGEEYEEHLPVFGDGNEPIKS